MTSYIVSIQRWELFTGTVEVEARDSREAAKRARQLERQRSSAVEWTPQAVTRQVRAVKVEKVTP